MEQNDQYEFYTEQTPAEVQPAANGQTQHSTPMGAPKRKSRIGGWIVGIVIASVVIAAGVGIYRTVRDMQVQIRKTDDGVSVRIGKKEQEAESKPQPQFQEAERPVQKQPQPNSSGSMTLQPSKKSVPNYRSAQEGALSLQEIYEKTIPSVVSIVTANSTGTGIVMTEDGYLITNCHVIEGAYEVRVMTQDEQVYDAQPVGADEATDLAVLKILPKQELTPAQFGDSDVLRVGDSVCAIGDPLGIDLRGTMTSGIVSAINRDMTVNNRVMTLIQTDAALNNGNSGGPLINCYGQVIGINVMKLTGGYYSEGVEGLGFAIPVSTAKPIIDELIEKGYVSGRPAIGISGESLPMPVRAFYRLPDGVYVTYVSPESDAYSVGLREADIITALNGVPIRSMEDLNAAKNGFAAGDVVTLTVYHAGVYSDVQIRLMDEAQQ